MSNFQHYFFDKLRLDDYHIYLKSLRRESKLNRNELSELIGVSSHTIRRYESEWQNSNPPEWYEMLLRFLCGDISYFGTNWIDCRINNHNNKLSSPCFKTPMSPHDMNTHYNRINLSLTQENRALSHETANLKEQLKQLQSRIDLLESEKAHLETHKNSVKTGKVVPIFGKKA